MYVHVEIAVNVILAYEKVEEQRIVKEHSKLMDFKAAQKQVLSTVT